MVAVVYGPSMTARTGLRVPGWALVSAVAAPVSMIGGWILADSRQQSFDAVGEDPPTDHRDGRSHSGHEGPTGHPEACLLYTSDAADEEDSVDLGGRRIIKKK